MEEKNLRVLYGMVLGIEKTIEGDPTATMNIGNSLEEVKEAITNDLKNKVWNRYKDDLDAELKAKEEQARADATIPQQDVE
ncbi:unnamed protein product [marine sediment metagenome]|uniref:Uncharacterized protein n=1 Tax=marine sediment metagenome TaxID=412755 RepID=X1BJT0_9ZZZZ